MTSNVSVLLSPFWESVDERWIGGSLLILSAMMLCSQALAIARIKSWRMYLTSIMFTMLTAVLVAPLADAHSPRELQRWIMMPQTLGTLAVLQILWIGVTVFLSVQEELKILDPAARFAAKTQAVFPVVSKLFIRLITALPSPVFLLFLVWIEQNLLMESSGVRPQIIGFYAGMTTGTVLTILSALMILWFRQHQLIGLHLLVGCILLMMCVLIPCLTQKLYLEANSLSPNFSEMTFVFGLLLIFVLVGVVVPKNLFQRNKK